MSCVSALSEHEVLGAAALLGVLTATVVKFHAVDPAAAYIMLPYLGWTTFATVLTIDIYRRNPDVRPLTVRPCMPESLTDSCSC